MEPIIIREKISQEELVRIVRENFGDMAKVDVDIERGILTIGGEWHSEGDALLVGDGSLHENIWGMNFYPWREPKDRIEYISLINIKPQFGNCSMEVEDKQVREQMKAVVETLLLGQNELFHV